MDNKGRKFKNVKLNLISTYLLLAGFSQASWGLQTKSVTENGNAYALVSQKYVTRIAVANDRILNVKGPNGIYAVDPDNNQGAIYLHITNPEVKVFAIFISTEQGHNYILHLTPKDIDTDSILLKPKGIVHSEAQHWEESTPYTQTVTQLISDMVNQNSPEGYDVSSVIKAKKQYLGSFATLQLKQTYTGDHLQGLVYELINRRSTPITLTENEFYQAGDRAIAVANLNVPAEGSTWVYRVVSHDE